MVRFEGGLRRLSFLLTPTASLGDSQSALEPDDCWKDSQNFLEGNEFGTTVHSREEMQIKSVKKKRRERVWEDPQASRRLLGHVADQGGCRRRRVRGFVISGHDGRSTGRRSRSRGTRGTRDPAPLSRALGLLPWPLAAQRLAGVARPVLGKDASARRDVGRLPEARFFTTHLSSPVRGVP